MLKCLLSVESAIQFKYGYVHQNNAKFDTSVFTTRAPLPISPRFHEFSIHNVTKPFQIFFVYLYFQNSHEFIYLDPQKTEVIFDEMIMETMMEQLV